MNIPEVEWEDFYGRYFRWQQGEHVSLIGPTGLGKTTLAHAILPRRRLVNVLSGKPKDPVLDKLRKEGYTKYQTWPGADKAMRSEKVLLWPPLHGVTDMQKQALVFSAALDDMFRSGHWCVYADELRYLCENLGLKRYFELYWLQGRSLLISLVASAQRPAFVPTLLYDQATHLFFWRDNDETNLKRIGGIGWLNSRQIRETVAALPKYEVLYINTRTGQMIRTKVAL